MSEINKKSSKISTNKCKITLKEILTNTCIIFTVIIIVLYLLTTLILGNITFTTSIWNTAAIFALSFVLSAVTVIVEKKKLPLWESCLILFVLVGAIYYLLVVRLGGIKDIKRTAAAIAVYAAGFIIYVIIKLLIRRRKKTKNEETADTEYQSKF